MGTIRYVVFALVALMFTLYTWLGGGIVAEWLSPWTPWLTLLIAEAALLLPEQRHGETIFQARSRVWRGLLRDPLTWLTLGLSIYLLLQWFNSCTVMQWNPSKKAWQVLSPAFEWLRHPSTAAALANAPANPSRVDYQFLPATFAWLPSALKSDEAWNVLDWFPPILVALLAMKHATGRRTKRLMLIFVCAMTSVLAIAGIVQYVVDGTFLYWGRQTGAFFFATFGYPNHAACFFPAVLLLALGLALWSLEYREHTRTFPMLYGAAAALCALSAVLSESRAGMLFTLAITAFSVLYVPIRYFGSWTVRSRLLVTVALGAMAVAVLGTAAFRIYAIASNSARAEAIQEAEKALKAAKAPVQAGTEATLEPRPSVEAAEAQLLAARRRPLFGAMPMIDPVLREIYETPWADYLEHPMLMRSGYQGILALRQHDAHPWFGTGAWSFRWLNSSYIDAANPEEREWYQLRKNVGQGNVHNDTLQFLAEHGWIGFGMMLGCVAALFLPFLAAFLRSPGQTVSDQQADRCWLNRLNVAGVYIFAATTLIALHSFMDLVFRSPACMMLYGLLFVCAPGCFLGARKKGMEQEPFPATQG